MGEHKAECQGCGLSPNVRSGDVVIWCDECYSELRDRLARMKPVVDAACKYEGQWYENRNLQPFLHRLMVSIVREYKEGE